MAIKKGLVSIVIINWNGTNDLKDLLPSLEKVKYKNFETIIVDHGSADGSIEYIKKNYPKIKLLEKKKNLGFALGNNVGVKEAKGEYILLLNNDTIVKPDFLLNLVDVIENDNKIGVVQPKIIFADSKKLQSTGTYFTSTGFLYHTGYNKDPNLAKYNKRKEIFSANGSCMLIKREVIEKVGLFDKDFFLYFEETDFCWRVWLTGYKIIYEPKAAILHKGSRATKRLPSYFVNFHSFKNRINTLIKNLGFLKLIKILPVHLFLCEAASISFLARGGIKVALSTQHAIFWNIFNLGRTLKKRKRVQEKIRKVEDKNIMPRVKRKVRLSYYYYLSKGLVNYKD